MDVLNILTEFYNENCDGDWEHTFGIKLDTIDNPGWSLKIDLTDTMLSSIPFEKVTIERTEDDWIHSWVKNDLFESAGGSKNLNEMLEIFAKWYLSNKKGK